MDKIKSICTEKNLILIEDTCESMGAEWDKKAGTFGDVSSFSSIILIIYVPWKEALLASKTNLIIK